MTKELTRRERDSIDSSKQLGRANINERTMIEVMERAPFLEKGNQSQEAVYKKVTRVE